LAKLGGLKPLVRRLHPGEAPVVQEAAAHALGTAASNNAKLQELVLAQHGDVFEHLVLVRQAGACCGVKTRYNESKDGGV